MKKIFNTLIIITLLLTIVGCSKKEDETTKVDDIETEEKEELEARDYIEIAYDTLKSNAVGKISGEYQGGLFEAGYGSTTYEGTVSESIATITTKDAQYDTTIEENKEVNFSDINTTDDLLKITASIFTFDGSNCTVEDLTTTCEDVRIEDKTSSITDERLIQAFDISRQTYTFEFNNDNTLKNISINTESFKNVSPVDNQYSGVTIATEKQEEIFTDMLDKLRTDMKFNADGYLIQTYGITFLGNIERQAQTIEY